MPDVANNALLAAKVAEAACVKVGADVCVLLADKLAAANCVTLDVTASVPVAFKDADPCFVVLAVAVKELVAAIDALPLCCWPSSSKLASGADARGLKPSMC